MRPGFRSLSAVLRKVRAGGELSQRLPTLETLSVWARGGLYVPGCWESERPWNELAALVDSGRLSDEMLSRGTELAGQVLQLMEESLKDPQARRKLVQSPTLLLKFAQMVGKASLPLPVLEPAKPQEPELDPQTAALRAMSDEELYALIHGLDEQEKAELPSES